MACLGVNMDWRQLWGTDASGYAALYYSTNYATKQQQTLLKKFPVLKTKLGLYKQRRESGIFEGKDFTAQQKSLLSSVLMGLQANVEISLPTIVNHLLQQPECLRPASERFYKLLMYPFLELADAMDEERDYPIDSKRRQADDEARR